MRLGRVLALLTVVTVLASLGAYKLMTTRSFQLFGGLTKRVETPRKVVALTFDDGPTCPDVDGVLRTLNHTPATFFLLGTEIEQCPDGARKLAASGADMGNHTWDHRRMVFVAPQTVAREIEPTDALIRQAGYRDEILFRPPYGKKLAILPWWLHEHDRRTIMWDVGVETFGGTPQDTTAIVDQTIQQVRPGSIILLHPWNGRTATQAAIPQVIAQLQQRGYTFLTVSELLGE